MRNIGMLVLVVGLVGLIAALGIDTTVQGLGNRVHNIGLMSEKQNYLIVSIAIALAGIVMIVFSHRNKSTIENPHRDAPDHSTAVTKLCPFCAERIMVQAVVCRFCNRDLPPLAATSEMNPLSSAAPDEPAMKHRTPGRLAAIAISLRNIMSSFRNSSIGRQTWKLLEWFSDHLGWIGSLLLLSGLGGIVYVSAFVDYSHFGDRADGIQRIHLMRMTVIILASLVLLLRRAIVKPVITATDSVGPESANTSSNKAALWTFFGIPIDLAVVQISMLVAIWGLHNTYHPSLAYLAASLVVALGYLLIQFRLVIFGYATLVFGLLYLVYRHVWFSSTRYMMKELGDLADEMRMAPFLDTAIPYLWLLLISIAIPHCQLLRFGKLQFGRLRGDTSLTLLGHTIFLSFTSAFVFCVLWFGISNALEFLYHFALKAVR